MKARAVNDLELVPVSYFECVKLDGNYYYLETNQGKFFSLNEYKCLMEVLELPEASVRIDPVDPKVRKRGECTAGFFCKVCHIGTEFSDDITLFLENGFIVSSFLDYDNENGVSCRELGFYTSDDIIELEVCDDIGEMEAVEILLYEN